MLIQNLGPTFFRNFSVLKKIVMTVFHVYF
jgi:hypothetical protein